jgi:hypothetical protein
MTSRAEKKEEGETHLKTLDATYQLAFPEKDAIITSNK